jgi:hypothetical protein
VPSLWIVLFESLFQIRIKGLKKRTDYSHNLKLLLRKLEKIGSVSLRYLDVDKLLEKDPVSIDRITDLFWELYLALEDQKIQEEEQDWKSRLEEHDVPRLSGSTSGSQSLELPDMTEELTTILPDGPFPTLIDEVSSPALSESVSLPSLRPIEAESLPSKFPSNSSNSSGKPVVNPKIRVNRKQEVTEWLTTVRDDIEHFEKKKSTTKPAKKQLRFESPKKYSDHFESPYLRSLKLRRQTIAKKRPQKVKPSTNLDNILRLHQQIHEQPDFLKRQFPFPAGKDLNDENADSNDIEELMDAIQPVDSAELSLPERNLERYMNQIKQGIPIPKIPQYETERAWKSQLMTTKRALETRLWNQKVQAQKVIKNLNHLNPLAHVVTDLRKKKHVQESKQERLALQSAKSNVQEQYRRMKLLQNQFKNSQDLVTRQQKREKMKQELVCTINAAISRSAR